MQRETSSTSFTLPASTTLHRMVPSRFDDMDDMFDSDNIVVASVKRSRLSHLKASDMAVHSPQQFVRNDSFMTMKRQKLGRHQHLPRMMAPPLPNPFDMLPIEANQMIASFLDYDQDICNFQLICRSARDAVDGDNHTFWRRRFLSKFEKPGWIRPDNFRFKEEYQKRRNLLKNGTVFRTGNTWEERQCLEMLAALVAESFSGKTNANSFIYECKNMEHIKRFFQSTNLLQIVGKIPRQHSFSQPPAPSRRNTKRKRQEELPPQPWDPIIQSIFMQTVQVIAAPMLLSFDHHIIDYHYGFPDSQRAVYSSYGDNPLFRGFNNLDINIPFVLHNLNFWKYHMIRDIETTLYYPFCDLSTSQRPQWWTSQPRDGEKVLPTHWKGSYAYVDREDIEGMRRGYASALQIQDHFAGEDTAFTFQDMTLSLLSDDEPFLWLPEFDRVLEKQTSRPRNSDEAKTRAQHRCARPSSPTPHKKLLNFRFDGEGQDVSEAFLTSGYLESLPRQQHGIPGWQRVVMMKYFEEEEYGIDLDALWAYEGVVLPGGKIMLGRWWSGADGEGEEVYSGPFILWAVEEE